MNRIRSSLLATAMASCVGLCVQAQTTNTVIFNQDLPPSPIGLKLQLFDDPTSMLGVRDLAMHMQAFRQSTSAVPNLGLSSSAHWAKFMVVNADPVENMVLLVDYPEIEQLEIYLEQSNRITSLYNGGQQVHTDRNLQKSPSYTFNLNIPYGGIGTIYIRTKSEKQLQLPVFVISSEESLRTNLGRNFFLGGYIGIMLVMVLYNLFIYFSIKDRSYIKYVLYIIFVTLTQLSFIGWFSYYIIPGWAWGKEHASLIFTVATAIMSISFMRSFLHMGTHSRTVLFTIIGLMLLGVAMDVSGWRLSAYGLIQLLSFILAIYLLVVSVIFTRRQVRSARYFLVAWSVFLAGIVVFVAKDWGLVPYNDLTKYMMTIGSSIEVVLLSFGLADKINVLQREKSRSQAEALGMAKANEEIIRDQNTVLEQKVAERTHALQESNDHLKRTQSQLVNAEKMASLGQLTAGIAHEINNPLNFISSNIPPLKRDLLELKAVLDAYRAATPDSPAIAEVHALEKQIGVDYTVKEVEEILTCMETGAMRTSEIVRGLRTFSRLDEDDLKEADINEGLRSTLVVLGPQFRDAVDVQYDLATLPPVECFPGKLNQLFMNLLNNAAHAVKQRHGLSGGKISIATRLEADRVVIDIEDNGMGMDERVQARLFEPFFTTKDVGEGTGLGLSIALGIIDKHHGRINVESAVGKGTRFSVTLPVKQHIPLAKSA